MRYWIRWFALGPAVFAAFVLVGIAAGLISDALGVWYEPVVGAACAAAFVFVSYVLAPEFKVAVATYALIAGAVLAWQLTSPPSFYPENYAAYAYVPSYLPIVVTYVAGLLSWCACVMHSRRRDLFARED